MPRLGVTCFCTDKTVTAPMARVKSLPCCHPCPGMAPICALTWAWSQTFLLSHHSRQLQSCFTAHSPLVNQGALWSTAPAMFLFQRLARKANESLAPVAGNPPPPRSILGRLRADPPTRSTPSVGAPQLYTTPPQRRDANLLCYQLTIALRFGSECPRPSHSPKQFTWGPC